MAARRGPEGGVSPAGGTGWRPALAVLERNLVQYRRVWWGSAFSSFVLPVMFLLSFGMGVGGYVGEIGGVPYLAWIVPGVLAATAFQMAVGECAWPVLGDFKWVRAYHGMAAAPVAVRDMLAGWFLYLLVRVGLSAVVFLAVAAAFGALRSPWALVTPLVAALLMMSVAAPMTAFSARLDTDVYFPLLFRFVVIPATLFGGVFFPVEQLAPALRAVAYATPLWHGVELCRAATLGAAPTWPVAVHVGYLAVCTLAGCWWAARNFRGRLYE